MTPKPPLLSFRHHCLAAASAQSPGQAVIEALQAVITLHPLLAGPSQMPAHHHQAIQQALIDTILEIEES